MTRQKIKLDHLAWVLTQENIKDSSRTILPDQAPRNIRQTVAWCVEPEEDVVKSWPSLHQESSKHHLILFSSVLSISTFALLSTHKYLKNSSMCTRESGLLELPSQSQQASVTCSTLCTMLPPSFSQHLPYSTAALFLSTFHFTVFP